MRPERSIDYEAGAQIQHATRRTHTRVEVTFG